MIREFEEIDWPEGLTLSSATVSLAHLGENTISAQVRDELGSYNGGPLELNYKGERYIMPLYQPQGAKENTRRSRTFDFTFRQWAAYQLQRYYFFTVQSIGTDTYIPDRYIASVSLTLPDFCILLGQVLEYWFGDTIQVRFIGVTDPTELPALMEISYSRIWDVIGKIYEVYGAQWKIVREGSLYVLLVGVAGEEISHIFEYGYAGGLLSVERQVQDDNIRNRLIGRGGSKNLPRYYFKQAPVDSGFNSDPDWVPELENAYFDALRSKEFRDYVSGWKLSHGGYSVAEAAEAKRLREVNWAFEKGRTDDKFDPPEYVEDVESIARYGLLLGGLDNNEEIYPSIQGRSVEGLGLLDEAVDVEQVTEDLDIAQDAAATAVTLDVPGGKITRTINGSEFLNGDEISLTVEGDSPISIPEGFVGNLDVKAESIAFSAMQMLNGNKYPLSEFHDWEMVGYVFNVYDVHNKVQSATGLPAGVYTYKVVVTVRSKKGTNTPKVRCTASVAGGVLTYSKISGEEDNPRTFKVWIKNIWNTAIAGGESPEEYARRVWDPILGDGEGNEAKLVFSSGRLSVSEDYEFRIIKVRYDNEKLLNGVASEWCLTLEKSDAELETTGLYIPSSRMNGEAGDRFFFIGIELPHLYVTLAEEELQNYKIEELKKVSEIRPTWSVGVDRVRANDVVDGKPLREWLTPGAKMRLSSPFQTPNDGVYEILCIQSVNLTFREPSENDAALNPDIELTLGTDYMAAASPVAALQGSIDALNRRMGALGDIESRVRAIGDKVYLRKDGIADRSISPTEFANLVKSYGFRQGMIGGQGWGFYRDENGNWVLEIDRLKARQDFEVNNLVVNQIESRGGMIVESAAALTISRVEHSDVGYICYFDQKGGSVVNLFKVDDVALCHRFNPLTKTSPVHPDSSVESEGYEKYYKRRVIAVGDDYVILADNMVDVNGSGIPAAEDNIVQYGNYTDATRRYVIVRDVVSGGYERFIEGLSSVDHTGVEYYFVGKQTGMYGGRSRFYIGNDQNFIEYLNGKLTIRAQLTVESTIGDKRIDEYISDLIPDQTDNYLTGTSQAATLSVVKTGGRLMLYSGWGCCPGRKMRVAFDYRLKDVIANKRSLFTPLLSIVGKTSLALPDIIANAEEWTHYEGVAEIHDDEDADLTITEDDPVELRVLYSYCMGVAGGLFEVKNAIMSVGEEATEWRPSSRDSWPLVKALAGNTSVSGGLVLTSMVATGEWGVDGAIDVKAGISGIVDPTHGHGGVVFWGGGSYEQAVAGTSTYVIYMDGTGHAAGGTVRFEESRLRVGDIISLSDSGMEMDLNGIPKMRIGNYSVKDRSDYIMSARELRPFPYDSSHGVHFYPPGGGYTIGFYAWTSGTTLGFQTVTNGTSAPAEMVINIGRVIQGTTVNLVEAVGKQLSQTFSVTFDQSDSSLKYLSSSRVYIEAVFRNKASGVRLHSETIAPRLIASNGGVEWDVGKLSWLADEDCDNVELALRLVNQGGGYPSGTLYKNYVVGLGNPNVRAYCQLVMPQYNVTELGEDGAMLSWGSSNQFQTNGIWGVRVGNCGLKVLDDGVYILRPGKLTWEKIDLTKLL